MNLVRLCLIVLLAALMPLRGAMAASALCPPAVGAPAPTSDDAVATTGAQGHDHAHGRMHDDVHGDMHGNMHAADAGLQSSPQEASHAHHHDGGQDRCSLCAACCSAMPLPSQMPGVAGPDAVAAAFPAMTVPAPTFESGGPERPPRSL